MTSRTADVTLATVAWTDGYCPELTRAGQTPIESWKRTLTASERKSYSHYWLEGFKASVGVHHGTAATVAA